MDKSLHTAQEKLTTIMDKIKFRFYESATHHKTTRDGLPLWYEYDSKMHPLLCDGRSKTCKVCNTLEGRYRRVLHHCQCAYNHIADQEISEALDELELAFQNSKLEAVKKDVEEVLELVHQFKSYRRCMCGNASLDLYGSANPCTCYESEEKMIYMTYVPAIHLDEANKKMSPEGLRRVVKVSKKCALAFEGVEWVEIKGGKINE